MSLGQAMGTITKKLSYKHLRHSFFIKPHRQIKCRPHKITFILFHDWSQHIVLLYAEFPVWWKNTRANSHRMHAEWKSAFSSFHVDLALCLSFGFRFEKAVNLCRFPEAGVLLSLPVVRPSHYACSYGIVRSSQHIATYVTNPQHQFTSLLCRLPSSAD